MEVPDAGPYGAEDWPGPQKGTAAMITRMDAGVGEIFEALQRLESTSGRSFSSVRTTGPMPRAVTIRSSSTRTDRCRIQAVPPRRRHSRADDRALARARAGGDGKRGGLVLRGLPADRRRDRRLRHAPGIDGTSLAPVLLDGKTGSGNGSSTGEARRGAPRPCDGGNGRPSARPPDEPLELFDLRRTPARETDVASQHPTIAAAIVEYLEGAVTELPDSPVGKREHDCPCGAARFAGDCEDWFMEAQDARRPVGACLVRRCGREQRQGVRVPVHASPAQRHSHRESRRDPDARRRHPVRRRLSARRGPASIR